MKPAIVNFPAWVETYKSRHGVYPTEYQELADEQSAASISLLNEMMEASKKHPDYEIIKETVDSQLDTYHYESGTIVGISKDRLNFDNLYLTPAEWEFRGGFRETKIGNHYVIYGFDFD